MIRMIEFFKGLLFVRKCLLCGAVLADAGQDAVFCPKCRLEYEKIGRLPCRSCGKRQTECRCLPRKLQDSVDISVHLFEFKDEISKKVLYTLKRKNRKLLQQFLGRELALAALSALGEERHLFALTYVPRLPKSVRTYGFDQAKVLCAQVAEQLGLPMETVFSHATRSELQKNLGASEREKNAEKSYTLVPSHVRKKDGLLILDDVVTTGSTMDRLARLARSAGYQKIAILSVARTVSNGTDKHG